MKAFKLNLLNSITLIILGIWGYLDSGAPTAFIPVGFGLILLICHIGVKKENKIVAHIAVLFTLVILLALTGMRLPKSLESGGIGLYRVVFMIITSGLSFGGFLKSFIDARKKKV